MNGTVCLLRSVRHAMLTSLKLVLSNLSQNCKYYHSFFSESIVIFITFKEVICFYVGSRNFFTFLYPYGFFSFFFCTYAIKL